MKKLTFGVFLPFYASQNQIQPHQKFAWLKRTVLEFERLGYHSVWIDDHLMYGQTPILECWSTLAAIASVTTNIRLGTMVTSAAFRNPAVLAKAAATVDAISNGRLEFGVGAGVQREEHEAYGLTFPAASARIARLQEAVEIIKGMWTQEKTTYEGKNFKVKRAVCEPKPLQKPHPPITIGGSGEKRTLKVTAKLANRVDFGYLLTLESYKHKLAVLEKHCNAVGRKFMDIEKSCWPYGQIILGEEKRDLELKISELKPQNISRNEYEKFTFVGTPEEFLQTLRPYQELGVTHFMLSFAELPKTDVLHALAEQAKELN